MKAVKHIKNAVLVVTMLIAVASQQSAASIIWSGEESILIIGLGPGENRTYFDLNEDDCNDIAFLDYEATLSFGPVAGNFATATTQNGYLWYGPISEGSLIAETLVDYVWSDSEKVLVSCMDVGCSGFWYGVEEGLLGLSFQIEDETHYGWIRLCGTGDARFILQDWAYESEPNTAIVAGAIPEPGTMTLFSAGCFFLNYVRRRRRK